jgi:hypothetical protein
MEKREDFYIPEEIVEWIGLKKSEYLSKIIDNQIPGDISFEHYHLYDQFVPGTIETPDKTYESIEDDQRIRSYIKTYSERSGFHQVVVGVILNDKKNQADVFVPILSLVSRESEIVKIFSVGTVVLGPILN